MATMDFMADIAASRPGLRVTPHVLRAARERVGLPLDEVAKLVNPQLRRYKAPSVTAEVILAWESGDIRPSTIEAEALSDTLLIPFCALLQTELPRPSAVDFRGTPGAGLRYDTLKRIATFDAYYRFARELVRRTETAEDVAVPSALHASLSDADAIEAVAQRIRRAIGLGMDRQLAWESDAEAFSDLRTAVEDSGVFVFVTPTDTAELRGLSKWEPGGPPAILVSGSDSTAARLFTTMHEYSHLVAASPSRAFICDPETPLRHAEQVANRIAAATLVPREPLLPLIEGGSPRLAYGDWPHPVRRTLRKAFNVTHPVIGIRLTQLGLATGPGRVKSFWKGGGGRGKGGITKVQRFRRQLGTRTLAVARAAVESKTMAPEQVARMLGLTLSEAEALLKP